LEQPIDWYNINSLPWQIKLHDEFSQDQQEEEIRQSTISLME